MNIIASMGIVFVLKFLVFILSECHQYFAHKVLDNGFFEVYVSLKIQSIFVSESRL